MKIDPHLIMALRMLPLHASLQAVFTVASEKPARSAKEQAEICAIADDFIRSAQDVTGMNAKKVSIYPGRKAFTVEGSPLLIRALVDHGRGVLRAASL